MGSTTYHMRISVRGALRNKAFKGWTGDNGEPLTPKRAEMELKMMRHKGIKYFPMGQCEGFDPETGCPGHPVEEEAQGHADPGK